MNKKEDSAVKKPSRWKRYLLFFVFFLVLCYLLLQLTAVQNFIANKITTYLGDKMEANVSIDNVDFSIRKGVEMNNILLSENSGDTILYANSLNVSLNRNLLSVFSGELDLKELTLEGGRASIIKQEGETQNNLSLLISKISPQGDDNGEEGKSFLFDVKKIHLDRFELDITDLNDGVNQIFSIEKGLIDIERLDLDNNDIIVNEISLFKPVIRIIKSEKGTQIINTVEELENIIKETVSSDSEQVRPLVIDLKKLTIVDGVFSYDDQLKAIKEGSQSMDFKHFELASLNLEFQNLEFQDGFTLRGDLKNISYKDDKGFVLESLASDSILINTKKIHFPELILKTDDSHVTSDLEFKFRSFESFSEFEDKVIIQSDLAGSKLALKDLVHFVGSLEDNPFFSLNRNRVAKISGKYFGRVNNLNAKNVSIQLDNGLSLTGNINTRNITDKEEALVNFGLKELVTSVGFLHELIPGFEPPDNFYSLGNIRFKGRFDGYFQDFVAYGELLTDIGAANMDMRLDIKNGAELANYSGELALNNFDLGIWTGSSDLGKITASSKVENGIGLKPGNIETDLNAVVQSFTFKEHNYRDFVVDGIIKENAFDGLFKIDQEEVSFAFDGIAKVVDGQAKLNFDAQVQQLDLMALNLSSEPWAFKGNINIDTEGNGINSFVGNVVASDIHIMKGDSTYNLDTVSVIANEDVFGRELYLYSDIADGEMTGEFQLEKVAQVAKKILAQNYPFHTKGWTYNPEILRLTQDFDFRLKVKDSKNIFDLIGIPGLILEEFQSKGRLSNINNSIDFDAIVGHLRFNEHEFHNSHLNISTIADDGGLVLDIDSSNIGGILFNPISLDTKLKGDSVSFVFQTDDIIDSLERINIRGNLDPHPKGYRLNLDENEWNMLGTLWDFDETNDIVFGKDYLNIENFSLTDGIRKISIFDINEKGVQLEMKNFDFLLIDGLINYDKISFSGPGDVYLSVDDIFKKNTQGMLNVSIPNFKLNDESYGSLEVTALKASDDLIKANVSILRDTMSILVSGDYDLNKGEVLANAKLKKVPMDIFEYIIDSGISNTHGTADAAATLSGKVEDLKLDGEVMINNFGVTVDYLGATFLADKQVLKVTENYIDATGGFITDKEGNIASLTGGLRHGMFRDFRQELVIETQNGIVLDTDKQDNPYYYGFGKGQMRAEFSGKFESTNLVITAIAGAGTELNIPVGAVAEGYDESFIKFVDRDKYLNKTLQKLEEEFEIKGLDIQMNITLTPEAKVSIIFNEALGDVIVGYGQGDIQVDISRTGDFNVFGEYEIERGEYLFTALGIVAKSFKVDRGGLIKWTGDPINATLDFEGYYEVDASLETFIAEYLFDEQLAALARNKTPVALKMDLSGRLYEPQVSFDLDFPELIGELKAYAENKIRTLRQNEIALNNQVVGLLAFQTFLPDLNGDVLGSGSFLQTAGVSTISEFLSSQLSRLFTGLFEAALTDNGLIAGVDFDIGLVKNNSLLQQSDTGFAPDEIEINFKNRFRFLGERLSLNVGGNYVRESVLNNGAFFGVDFALEYYLTDDRKIKLRMYGRNDVDQFIENGRQQQYGFGIGYRTEFGTLADFQEGLNQSIKEAVNQENQ